jgi:hypothetical protein
VIPIKVNTNQSVSEASAGTDSDLLPAFVRTEYQLGPGPVDTDRDEDRRCSVIVRNDRVSPISVEEDRAREALGLPVKVRQLYF